MSNDIVLKTEDLTKHYGGVHALEGANFEIRKGEHVAIMGDNGAGKSTFVRQIWIVEVQLNRSRGRVRAWTDYFLAVLSELEVSPQAVDMLIVSLPIQLGSIPAEPAAVGVIGWIGAGLAIIGILFETIGDFQLARFKAKETGGVLDTGLWRYTRHPNYFGDTCVWWGLFLIAAETTLGLFSIIGPLLMTYLLLKWSGAALLERRMKRAKPEYEDYVRRTSAFIPWPPKSDPQ